MRARRIFRGLLAVFFLAAGLNHFLNPDFYLGLMPPYLPWPMALILISGVVEIAGGVGVLIPGLRRAAAWGLIALLIAIFPANLQAALHGFLHVPAWVLWVRLPGQLLFIFWVWQACLAPAAESPKSRSGGGSSVERHRSGTKNVL